MIAHGISTGALFVIAGILQERTHTRDMRRFEGLWSVMPRLAAMGLFFAIAVLGLPGMGNFVGEFLILMGLYRASSVLASVAAVAFVASVVYALALVQKTFHGENTHGWQLHDLSGREMATLYSMAAITLWLGLYPQPVLDAASGIAIVRPHCCRSSRGECGMNLVPSALHSDLMVLSPLILLAGSAVVVMLAAAFYRHPRPVMMLTLAGLVLSFASLFLSQGVGSRQVTALLVLDHYALFFIGLIVAATFVVAVLCYRYFGGDESRHEALYILLLLAALGGAVLVASSHFASFLLGLELLSISLFALIAYPKNAERPLEAGIKYLVLAGFSSAFLLFGMALIYAQLGTMQFAQIGARLAAPDQQLDAYGLAGLALIVAGVGFKLALVPFHMWTPDVYEGAPAPIAAFIATVSKGAMLAMLLRYFIAAGAHQSESIALALSLIAIVTILAGNLLALRQDNIKRILAYSSIAQLGYLLVGFLAFGAMAVEAVAYYLAAYFVTMLGAFGVVTVLSRWYSGTGQRYACRLCRSVLAQAMAGGRVYGHAAFTRRHPADDGFHWQVLRARGRGRRVFVATCHCPGGRERDRAVLLSANYRRDVRA